MRESSFGPVFEAHEVTEDMMPEPGSHWIDTYNLHSPRTAVVVSVSPAPTRGGVWIVKCQEEQLWKREFTMTAHGFLSRYVKYNPSE